MTLTRRRHQIYSILTRIDQRLVLIRQSDGQNRYIIIPQQ